MPPVEHRCFGSNVLPEVLRDSSYHDLVDVESPSGLAVRPQTKSSAGSRVLPPTESRLAASCDEQTPVDIEVEDLTEFTLIGDSKIARHGLAGAIGDRIRMANNLVLAHHHLPVRRPEPWRRTHDDDQRFIHLSLTLPNRSASIRVL